MLTGITTPVFFEISENYEVVNFSLNTNIYCHVISYWAYETVDTELLNMLKIACGSKH